MNIKNSKQNRETKNLPYGGNASVWTNTPRLNLGGIFLLFPLY
jgi:hypothetical protein